MTSSSPQAIPKQTSDHAIWLEDQIAWMWDHWEDPPANSLEVGHEIIRTARVLKHDPHLALSLRFVASLNTHRAEYLTGLHYLVESLEVFTALHNTRQVAACQNEIGAAYLALGDCADVKP
jgi:hypothetical protein